MPALFRRQSTGGKGKCKCRSFDSAEERFAQDDGSWVGSLRMTALGVGSLRMTDARGMAARGVAQGDRLFLVRRECGELHYRWDGFLRVFGRCPLCFGGNSSGGKSKCKCKSKRMCKCKSKCKCRSFDSAEERFAQDDGSWVGSLRMTAFGVGSLRMTASKGAQNDGLNGVRQDGRLCLVRRECGELHYRWDGFLRVVRRWPLCFGGNRSGVKASANAKANASANAKASANAGPSTPLKNASLRMTALGWVR
jgi:hypothetical protein